jgi:hypothetical protein
MIVPTIQVWKMCVDRLCDLSKITWWVAVSLN